MSAEKSLSAGVKYGLIAGLVYVILLFVQFNYASGNPITFSLSKIGTYILILVIFLLAALARRKELGGYADFRSLLQTIIVVIIITEVCYGIFTYVYLTYVDPQFMDNFINRTMIWLEKNEVPQEQIDKQVEMMKSGAKTPTIGTTLLGIGMWIILDTIFGIIIAAITRKSKPVFENSLT